MKNYKSIEEYIKNSSPDHQPALKEVRTIVSSTIKDAEEMIAYGMPAFKWQGKPLFYFAAMKGHLGLYPTSGPIKSLANDLAKYSTSKGCIRIPWGTKPPKTLIQKLLKERKKEINLLI